MSSSGLTDRERAILQLIIQLTEERGFPPTIREIGEAAGISSTNGVRYFLQRLEAKGELNLVKGQARAIDLKSGTTHSGSFRPHLAGPEALSVPLVGRVAAGLPVLSEENVEGHLLLDPTLAGHGTVFALRVHGESMKDAGILDGDTLIVRKQAEARSGEIVVALVDDEATVKTLRRTGSKIVLEPANPAFSPIEIGPDRTFEIVGKVVSVMRRLDLS